MKLNCHSIAVTASALLLFATSLCAEPVRINFDTDFAGRPLTSGTLLNDAYPSDVFRFGSDDQIIRTGDGVPSLPNFAVGGATLFGPPALDVFFLRPMSFVQASNVTASHWTLLAFGARDQLLGSVSVIGFPETGSVRFAASIHRVQFIHATDATTAGYGIDDLQFDVTPVPEPTSFLLFATGAVIAGMRRRGRTERA